MSTDAAHYPLADAPTPDRMLGVWAHPDDEAYMSAGLMGRVTDAGGQVSVLTATRGERGTSDPARFDTPAFGAMREAELRASLAELGVEDLRILGYADGGLEAVADEEGIEAVTATIVARRPEMIVTFGPDGVTGHGDHQRICSWTTEAWRRCGIGDLVYVTTPDPFLDRHRELHDRIGLFDDFGLEAPVGCHPLEVALAYALDDAELDRKRRALAAHHSQTTPLATEVGEETYRTWWGTECFRRPTALEAGLVPAVAA